MERIKKTERVNKLETLDWIYEKMMEKRNEYLLHRYQVSNDNYVWKSILSTVAQLGPIYHMDFSENISVTPKFEPQSAHFSKRQFTLHCTVKHDENNNTYIYHLSNDLKHDDTFTMNVVRDILDRFPSNADVLRFKSDNCSTQYKSKYLFFKWRKLATEISKKILLYYGVSGHGKGLVDSMSAFRVKTPLRNAVLMNDFCFNSAEELKIYLEKYYKKDNWVYAYIDNFDRAEKDDEMKINKCRKQHMISFSPNGAVEMEENICDCTVCLMRNFVDCKKEKGRLVVAGDDVSDEDSSDEYDSSDFSDNEDEENEVVQLHGDNVFGLIEPGSVVAVYSPPNASEVFYLCKVVSIGEAHETLVDKYNHRITEGSKYLSCNYLEKIKEKKSVIHYKLVKGEALVMPYQVFCPSVTMSEQLTLTVEDYVFLCDMV